MGAAKVPLKGFIKKYVDDLLRVTEDRAARYADNVAARNGPQISRSAELRFRPGDRLRERMQRNPALRDEYRRQLAMQERGLNAMSVDEFLQNRRNFGNFWRGSGRTQRVARERLLDEATDDILAEMRSRAPGRVSPSAGRTRAQPSSRPGAARCPN